MEQEQLEYIHTTLAKASAIAALTTLGDESLTQEEQLVRLVSTNVASFDTALALLLRHPEYAHHVAMQMERDFQATAPEAQEALYILVDGFVEHCPIERLEVEDAVGS